MNPAPGPDGAATVTVDLNADLGEGFGAWSLTDDDALLAIVTSANVACGFHAGDPSIMRRVTARAADLGVAVGAQVGYRDLAGFGRRAMDVPAGVLRDDVLYQLGALSVMAEVAGTTVAYVKPHGALYNRIAVDPGQAAAVMGALAEARPGMAVLVLPGSVAEHVAAEVGLRPVAEAYPDRGYRPDGTLVPRSEPGALVERAGAVARRAVRLALEGRVVAAGGGEVPVAASSLCLHGDAPGAVRTAAAVRAALEAAGVALRAFT